MKAAERNRVFSDLHGFGSLLTVPASDGSGKRQCLGDLMHFEGHGVYDPTYGKVPVTPEDAKAHNAALDQARMAGLEHCKIGQGDIAYWKADPPSLVTFSGTPFSHRTTTVAGNTVYFERTMKNGDVWRFRATKRRGSDMYTFVRVA